MNRSLVSCVASAFAAAALAGCGGGSSRPDPVVETVSCDRDGNVFSSGLHPEDSTEMSVGDNMSNVAMQAFVSFPLSLAEGATVEKAVLRLYDSRLSASATNLHLTGDIQVEHLLVDFGALDATDFAANPAGLTSCAEFSSVASGWVEVDLTAAVRDDVADGRTRSQFRLYRTTLTDEDGAFDVESFYTSESPANQPELVITYTP